MTTYPVKIYPLQYDRDNYTSLLLDDNLDSLDTISPYIIQNNVLNNEIVFDLEPTKEANFQYSTDILSEPDLEIYLIENGYFNNENYSTGITLIFGDTLFINYLLNKVYNSSDGVVRDVFSGDAYIKNMDKNRIEAEYIIEDQDIVDFARPLYP